MRLYCMYYLPAAPFNFIFRDRDLQLSEENGNAGPAPRAASTQAPTLMHKTSRALRCCLPSRPPTCCHRP